MGIAADIVEFFYTSNPNHPLVEGLPEFKHFGLPEPKLLGQFMLHANNFNRSEILPVIQQLIAQGLLIPTGKALEGSPPMNETYYSPIYCPDSAAYGMYDFAASGFPKIYNQFKDSVQAVVVTKENEDQDIGSGFSLSSRMFVTALHCILDMKKIEITGWNPYKAPLSNIYISADDRIDLAILKFEADPLPGASGFLCGEAKILDNILTMGYPPLPGFDKVLVAEKGQVAGHLKSTTGQIVT